MTHPWTLPQNWTKITSIDAHTGGEPLRILTSGFPELPGDSILAKRRYAQENFDHLRTALMCEPRGHADMYGCVLTEPVTADGDFGILFLHNAGFSTMCGHGIIAIVKVGLETGLIQKEGNRPTIKIDTPAGRVTAVAKRENGRVSQVSFRNVPSFVYALEQRVTVPAVGPIKYDVAYGGAFYAFVSADELGLGMAEKDFGQLIDVGIRIKKSVMQSLPIKHPFEEDLGFLYGVIFVGAAHDAKHHSRNVCMFADGEIDRSPTGTGISARAALHFAKGEIGINEPFMVESILGSTFTGEVVETLNYGPYAAVIPQITGTAHIVGRNELLIDPEDPLQHGFILR